MNDDEENYNLELSNLIEAGQVFGISHSENFGDLVADLIASANRDVPAERLVSVQTSFEILENSMKRNLFASSDYRKLAAFRELNEFLNVAINGGEFKLNPQNASFLPLGHPLCPANSSDLFTEREVLTASIAWAAADPKIPAELRPLVASALTTDTGSVERAYVHQRISALRSESKPLTAILSLI